MHAMRSVTMLCLAGSIAGYGLNAIAAGLTPVAANPKVVGVAAPNFLSPELVETPVAQGSTPLENPSGQFGFYGYNADGPHVPAPGAVQSPGNNVEATKTEPDKNTYLVLPGLNGPDSHYDYGKRFLFQGHENSKDGHSYITRINLDADAAHRVTLLATTDTDNNPIQPIDGSTWYPWSRHLLFSVEVLTTGGIWQATPGFPSVVDNLVGVFGHGGYEGVQADSHGNVWVVEDVGGKSGTKFPHARQPNSFVYRLIPNDKGDLRKGGKLQALQVIGASGPIVFNAADVDGDISSQNQIDLHTYGKVFRTSWVTIHDTDHDGFGAFNANALAKAAKATPFKRPENGQFRPGSNFREFYFDATGDTNALTEAKDFGGFGGIFKLTQSSPSANHGLLTLFYKGDVAHTGLDNVAFWSDHEIVLVEDAGDTLHTQRNAFDSAYLFDVRFDYSDPNNQPVRIIALGRDPSATLDAGLAAVSGSGFQNEGDNEITGIHVSDGDPGVGGILGAKEPRLFRDGWRAFYTQQHGENVTWEILPSGKSQRHEDDEEDR
jgi:hypothetical protein